MATSKITNAVRKTAEVVTEGYQKIEDGVVGGYQKIEDGVVGGFTKIADKFVDTFLTRDGETVEEAKQRLSAEQAARKAASKKAAEQRAAEHQARMAAGQALAYPMYTRITEKQRKKLAPEILSLTEELMK